jgi:hypothetical protein
VVRRQSWRILSVAALALITGGLIDGWAVPLWSADGASPASTTATSWLPSGCHLVQIAPASTGYAICPTPAGMRLPNGYEFVHRGAPKVHAKTGASG